MNQTYPTTTADGREIYEWGDPFMSPDLVKLAFEGIDSAAGGVHLLVTRHPERVREMWPDRYLPNDYPILQTVLGFPSAILAPHDKQAQRNHGGQTLARLKERGGLIESEMLAILEDRPWCDMDRDAAYGRLIEIRKQHVRRRPNVILLIHAETQAEVNTAASHLAALSPLCGVVGLELVPREMIDIPDDFLPDMSEECNKCVDECRCPRFAYLTIHGGDEPCHPDFIRGPIRQAEAAQVPVWFGGWGEWVPRPYTDLVCDQVQVKPDGGLLSMHKPSLDAVVMSKVGPARSGRTLDGREWGGVPVMPINS